MFILNIKSFLEDIGEKINDLLGNYTSSPAFWIITALAIFIICYWAIKYIGNK